MAFTSIAALVAGEAATTTLVLGAVAEVGTAMTVVGAVTGSKDLMKAGAVMGLAGGVGGAIAGGASSVAATGADAVNSFDSGAMQGLVNGASGAADTAANIGAANALSDNYGGADFSQMGGPETTTTTASTAPVASQPVLTPQTLGPAGSQVPATSAMGAGPATTPPAVQPVADVSQGPATFQTGAQAPVGALAPTSPADDILPGVAQYQRSGIRAPVSSDNLFSRFSDWAKQNKTLVTAGTQVLGGAMNGMNKSNMFDQNMQLQRDIFNRANSVGTAPQMLIPKTGIIGGATQ